MNNRNEQNQMGYIQQPQVPYENGYIQQPQTPYGNGYIQQPQALNGTDYQKRGFRVSASRILGILSAVLLAGSVFLPAIDFSYYHESIKLRYSILKICENVGLISDMWRGIPIGILIAAGLMLLLAFVKIPPLKVVPCIIVLCMIILAIADIGNVADWISGRLQHTIGAAASGPHVSISAGMIVKSFQIGMYALAAGLGIGIISCFVSASD